MIWTQECALSLLVRQSGGAVDSFKGIEALQSDLHRLESWNITNYMKLNKS